MVWQALVRSFYFPLKMADIGFNCPAFSRLVEQYHANERVRVQSIYLIFLYIFSLVNPKKLCSIDIIALGIFFPMCGIAPNS